MSSKAKRYVVLYGNIFTERDWERLGCALFEAEGYEVLALECVDLMFKGKREALGTARIKTTEKAQAVRDVDDLRAIVDTIDDNDLVLMLLPLTLQTAWIYALFGERDVKYAGYTQGVLPFHLRMKSVLSFQHSLRDVWEDLQNRLYPLVLLFRRMLDARYGYWRLQAPTWWLRCGSGTSSLAVPLPKTWRAKPVPANQALMEPDSGPSFEEIIGEHKGERFAVFVDAAAANHPEWSLLSGDNPISENAYYPAMNRLFRHVEETLGLKVIIAAHPKSNYQPNDPVFEGRPIAYNATRPLVENSALVLSHLSTVVSYAVYKRKPIVLLTSKEYEATHFRTYTVAINSWLGIPRINIDDADFDHVRLPVVDERRYRTYTERFFCEQGFENASPWGALKDAFEADRPKPRPA